MVTVSFGRFGRFGRFGDSPSGDIGPEGSLPPAPAGVQSCLFCHAAAWRWFRRLGPAPGDAPVALPGVVVTCDECERLLDAGDRRAVIARVEALNPGEGAELLELFELHRAARRCRRPC